MRSTPPILSVDTGGAPIFRVSERERCQPPPACAWPCRRCPFHTGAAVRGATDGTDGSSESTRSTGRSVCR
jgi:hypothetical protein